MSDAAEKQQITEFVSSLGLEKDMTAEQYRVAIKAAIKDRAIIYYCIWKKLQQQYPGIDATKVMREAAWDFGIVKENEIAKSLGGQPNS